MWESGGGEYRVGFAEEGDEFFGEEDGDGLRERCAPGFGEGQEESEEEEHAVRGWETKYETKGDGTVMKINVSMTSRIER